MKPSSEDDYNNINKNQMGSSNVTLKSKIIALQEAIELVNEDFKANINDIKVLEKEKDEHQKVLKQKTEDMKKSLLVELAEVEKEMKKHLVA